MSPAPAAVLLDTTFLIDLEREGRTAEPGAAHALLERHLDARFHVPFPAVAELAVGFRDPDRMVDALRPFRVLWPTIEVCWRYAEIFRFLRRNGALIPANDLWIAATAVAHGMPLATRDANHLGRVPGLEVVAY